MPASDKKKGALKIAFLTLLWVHFAGKLDEISEEADDSDADDDETIALTDASDEMMIKAMKAATRLLDCP
ncbi:hypothetical protein AnigIFM63309_000817 [Aspergillus niger]|nr:hypothetical protein AnigIFM63309_000817 [Aspergillus niger]